MKKDWMAKKTKRQLTNWKKIFTLYHTRKGLISVIHIKLLKIEKVKGF